YLFESINVERSLHNLQLAAIDIVSNVDKRTTQRNIHYFLSLNYIWDMSNGLPGVQLRQLYATLSSDVIQLCATLDQQLSDGVAALKLCPEYHSFEKGLEDTFCHAVLDALLTIHFPKKGEYVLDWANKATEGSKEGRQNGYTPDAEVAERLPLLRTQNDASHNDLQEWFPPLVSVMLRLLALRSKRYLSYFLVFTPADVSYGKFFTMNNGDGEASIYTEILPNTPLRIEYDDVEEGTFDTGRCGGLHHIHR
ncbi:hypothetical protein BGZ65_009481, partial [Modicella reniformis]